MRAVGSSPLRCLDSTSLQTESKQLSGIPLTAGLHQQGRCPGEGGKYSLCDRQGAPARLPAITLRELVALIQL